MSTVSHDHRDGYCVWPDGRYSVEDECRNPAAPETPSAALPESDHEMGCAVRAGSFLNNAGCDCALSAFPSRLVRDGSYGFYIHAETKHGPLIATVGNRSLAEFVAAELIRRYNAHADLAAQLADLERKHAELVAAAAGVLSILGDFHGLDRDDTANRDEAAGVLRRALGESK